MAGVLLALAPLTAAGAKPSASSVPPVIIAHPNNVMVNTSTTLTGIGFSPNSTLALSECSVRRWMVVGHPAPCDTGNSVTVTTNDHGGFTATFKVELCPRVPTTTPPNPPTSETCYIGVPRRSTVGTLVLEGAAKVTVTYP